MFRFLLWFVFYSFFCGFPGLVWGADDSSPSSIGILAAAGKALESVNENSHLYSDVFSIYEYERPVYLGRIFRNLSVYFLVACMKMSSYICLVILFGRFLDLLLL